MERGAAPGCVLACERIRSGAASSHVRGGDSRRKERAVLAEQRLAAQAAERLGAEKVAGAPVQAHEARWKALAQRGPRSLSLRANGIGAEEVQVLVEMVRANLSLTFLDRRYNQLRHTDCEALSQALKARPDTSPLSIDMEYQTQ